MPTIDVVTDAIPDFNIAGSLGIISLFVGSVIILIILGVVAFFVIRMLKYNKTIVILEDVSGSDDLEPVGKDKAMTVKIGKGGLEILYLRKRKVYRVAYGKRMGKNTYYFAIGRDGYWYNVTLGSLDEGMKRINIKPTNANMRYANESLQEIIKERYDKPSFWNQYGQMIMSITFIAFLVVMSYFMFDSFSDAAGNVEKAAEITKETAETLKEVIGGLDAVRSGGGGLVSADG